jgi:hypothetical protein
MKTPSTIFLFALSTACSQGADSGEPASGEETAGLGGAPMTTSQGGGGAVVGSAGSVASSGGASGIGGARAMGGAAGTSSSMNGSGGSAGTTVTPCPPDNPTACPASGGFTPACGAGHCTDSSGKPIVQATTYDTCHPDRLPTMGVGHPVNAMKGKFLPTLHGNEGDDDQCKYHVKVAVDNTAENQDVNFTLNATNLGDGSPVKDNDPTPAVDVFLTAMHLAPKTDVKSMMTSPGTFKVGPVRFDQCGEWTARFHFFNHCGNDFTDSPYASIAFYVNVP